MINREIFVKVKVIENLVILNNHIKKITNHMKAHFRSDGKETNYASIQSQGTTTTTDEPKMYFY